MGLCATHNAEAVSQFGNTPALAYLAIQLTAAMWADPAFKRIVTEASRGEPPVADRDAASFRRVRQRIELALADAGIADYCCRVGDQWLAAIVATHEWIARGGDGADAAT